MAIKNLDTEMVEVNNVSATDKYEDLALNCRKIFINDEINKEVIFDAVYYIHKLLAQDEAQGLKAPIDIYINTNGGFCSEGFILVDLIEQLKRHQYEINTIVTGTAYSFGIILALMGTHRYCYRHSDFMCHTITVFAPMAPLPDLKRTVRHGEQMEKMIKEYIMANTKITQSIWDKYVAQGDDWYLDADEAVKYGFCHEII